MNVISIFTKRNSLSLGHSCYTFSKRSPINNKKRVSSRAIHCASYIHVICLQCFVVAPTRRNVYKNVINTPDKPQRGDRCPAIADFHPFAKYFTHPNDRSGQFPLTKTTKKGKLHNSYHFKFVTLYSIIWR